MKRLIFSVVLFFVASATKAQHEVLQQVDSLKRALSSEKKDTAQVTLMARISEAYRSSNPGTAVIYAQEALKLARRINFPKGEAAALLALSVSNRELGNLPVALKSALEGLRLSQINRLLYQERFALARIANVYVAARNYPAAIPYYKEALLKYAGTSELADIAVTHMLIADAYNQMNNLDSAYYYIRLVYPNMHLTTNLPAPAFHIRGDIEAKRGNVEEAFKNYQQAIEEGLKVNELRVVGAVYNSMASLYKKINQADSAMSYAKKGLLLAQKLSLQNRILTAASLLAQLYEPVDVTQALQYRKIADAVKDSLYGAEKVEKLQAMALQEQDRQHIVEEEKLRLQNRIRVYALLGVVSVFIIIAGILFRNSRIKQKAYALLGKQKAETEREKAKAEQALADLKSAQAQIIQSEKMASLGELTVGIAHEIQNPLNFVNNFSDVNTELLQELKNELQADNKQEVFSLADDIIENEQKINHHGKRADAIVKGMLQHSRASSGKKELTDINALADEYLRLSYHGLRAKDKDFNADFRTNFDESIGKIEVVPQDIGRVLLNLYNNAFYSVNEKQKQLNETFEPIVEVSTKKVDNKVEISVKDNGNGIPPKALDKIFQPFFTTKPTGQGTGLGLSLSYDIIKAHGGELTVVTKEGEGAEFIIELPLT